MKKINVNPSLKVCRHVKNVCASKVSLQGACVPSREAWGLDLKASSCR